MAVERSLPELVERWGHGERGSDSLWLPSRVQCWWPPAGLLCPSSRHPWDVCLRLCTAVISSGYLKFISHLQHLTFLCGENIPDLPSSDFK